MKHTMLTALLVTAAVMVAACGSPQPATHPSATLTPQPAGSITEFPLPNPINPNLSQPDGITAGPGGNLWFTDELGNKIGRITPIGQITEFPLPTPCSIADCFPVGITAGPDGNLWFTVICIMPSTSNKCTHSQIGRITPTGQITEFPLPYATKNPDLSQPDGITAGPDGNLWFTDESQWPDMIGRITPVGQITEFPLPNHSSFPAYITAGPDGNLWFTEGSGSRIGRITPAGRLTEFPIPTHNFLGGITAGPDGNLWFTEICSTFEGTCTPGKIGRITSGK